MEQKPSVSEQKRIRRALRELQIELANLYGKDLPTVLVYGSLARGESDTESDIDIVLIYPRSVRAGVEIRRVGPILADLNLRYKVLISILPATESEYREASGPFWRNVRKEGVPLDTV